MKFFNAYRHPAHGFEAVKIGFSWPALFFGIVWMVVKRLWKFAGLWLLAYAACSLVEGVAKNLLAAATQASVHLLVVAAYIALWLVPPFKGNKWRDEDLTKRGYQLLKTVQAETHRDAMTQLMSTESAPLPRPAPSTSQ